MENENKKIKAKHFKKERARVIKLVEMAYKNDPRIKRQRDQEEADKLKKKQDAKDRKDKQRQEIVEREQAIIDAKQRELDEKADQEKIAKEERGRQVILRKEAIKNLSTLCEERATGTRYDRYWVQEFAKKFKTGEDLIQLLKRLEAVEGGQEEFKEELEKVICENASVAERLKIQQKKEEEQKKLEESKKCDWTADELSKLSKAIVKYPGAIPNRWKIITDFIDTDKTQKQVIAKA